MQQSDNNAIQNRRALLQGVEDGDLEGVQELLENPKMLETTDDAGNRLLDIAAANGHDNIVRLLLKKGAALDVHNLYGWTSLMQACRYGHENVVTVLLKNGADVNIKTIMGVSALTVAVRGGNTKVVERLLAENLVIDNAENVDYLCTPLMLATLHGRDELLRKLLQRGVPSNQTHKHTGWTPVMVAAMTDQLAMARLLVDKGCNLNRRNRLNCNALMIASCAPCQTKEVKGYLSRKTTDKPEKAVDPGAIIIIAVKKGNYAKVQEILDNHQGACNATSSDGATPIMYAAINGQPEMIKLLVRYGGDVNAKDYENGWTALMQATYYGKLDAAKCLLECGADANIRSKNNITAFDMALIINTDTALFRLLADKAMQRKKTATMGGVAPVDEDTEQYSTRAWQNTFSTDNLADGQTKYSPQETHRKGFMAKVTHGITRSWKSNKLTKTLKNISLKVENFENTLIAPDTDGQSKELNHGYSVTIAEPYSMTNHSAPKSRLSEAKLSPIIPPFQETSGIDKQSNSSQKKIFGSKVSMSASLNSSGESSVSRSVVKPSKFLYSPGNSGNYNNGSSPHSSGGASDVTHSFTLGHIRAASSKEPHSHSGDRYSDTVLSKIAQDHQRKHNRASTADKASGRRTRISNSAEQLILVKSTKTTRPSKKSRRSRRAGSTVSSNSSTSTLTLTPPQTPDRRRRASSHHSVSSKGSRLSNNKKSPSVNEEDELSGILRKLSLEKYNTIFEEQEIDMDTFLSLTNCDLKDMGITQELPQQQLLQVINKLNTKLSSRRPGSNYSYSGINTSSNNYNHSVLPSLGRKGGKSSSQWSYNSLQR